MILKKQQPLQQAIRKRTKYRRIHKKKRTTDKAPNYEYLMKKLKEIVQSKIHKQTLKDHSEPNESIILSPFFIFHGYRQRFLAEFSRKKKKSNLKQKLSQKIMSAKNQLQKVLDKQSLSPYPKANEKVDMQMERRKKAQQIQRKNIEDDIIDESLFSMDSSGDLFRSKKLEIKERYKPGKNSRRSSVIEPPRDQWADSMLMTLSAIISKSNDYRKTLFSCKKLIHYKMAKAVYFEKLRIVKQRQSDSALNQQNFSPQKIQSRSVEKEKYQQCVSNPHLPSPDSQDYLQEKQKQKKVQTYSPRHVKKESVQTQKKGGNQRHEKSTKFVVKFCNSLMDQKQRKKLNERRNMLTQKAFKSQPSVFDSVKFQQSNRKEDFKGQATHEKPSVSKEAYDKLDISLFFFQ